ncbi:hypothetical protein D3C85_1795690 [compost metagenome]
MKIKKPRFTATAVTKIWFKIVPSSEILPVVIASAPEATNAINRLVSGPATATSAAPHSS